MSNSLIINCTRFGDLLQTQPLVSGLAARGRRVGLVCLENFQGATALLRDVDWVLPLPAAALLAALDRRWPEALRLIQDIQDRVRREFPPQEILGLTASTAFRLLGRHMALTTDPPAEEHVFALDQWGFGRTRHPWAAFLLASTRRRGCSPFNLVDCFWKAADLPDGPRPNRLLPPAETALRAVAPLLEGIPAPAGYVGLQLGASEERRRWPVASFARLGERLWRERGLVPVLLGSREEIPLARRVRDLLPPETPSVEAAGRTSLPELAALLSRLRLLVTNDTGTMHLAAGLGVDVCALFLATAQPWDTGPYRDNALCLEPDMPCHPCAFGSVCPRGHACRQAIDPDGLARAVGIFLDAGAWPQGGYPGARAWRSQGNPEEGGAMDLASLSGHEDEDRTRWLRLQRLLYRRFLDDLPHDVLPSPGASGLAGGMSPAAREEILRELDQAAALTTLLEGQLQALRQAPLPPLKKKFLATWERVQGLWESSRWFGILGYAFANAGQELGEDLDAVAALLARHGRLMRAWKDCFAPPR